MKPYYSVFILFLFSVACVSGVSTQGIDFDAMEKEEKKFHERQKQELVAFMNLRTMFPEKRLRALAYAAGSGDITKINRLVDEGVDINSSGTSNATVLYWAFRERNLKGFTRLLELGADPNVVFDDGGSVMHWVAIHKEIDFLSVILNFGGDPNLKSGSFAQTPLFDVMNLKAGDDKECLLINILIEKGAKLDLQDLNGNTPLLRAAMVHRYDLAYKYMQLGADTAIENNMGKGLPERFAVSERVLRKDSESYKWLLKVKSFNQ